MPRVTLSLSASPNASVGPGGGLHTTSLISPVLSSTENLPLVRKACVRSGEALTVTSLIQVESNL